MSSIERGLAILELLAKQGGATPLHTIADTLNIPRSATHRLLSTLCEKEWVRQDHKQGDYQLGLKLVSLALMSLSNGGVLDIAQPVLEQLAQRSGELVRLSLVEEERLVFVAKAQGSRSGLRYDPDMGREAQLFCTATGHAWLACLSDEQALQIVSKQGFGEAGAFGPNAPKGIKPFLTQLQATRKRGYGMALESYEPGMAALAVAIRPSDAQAPLGVISIAGPISRLSEAHIVALAPAVQSAARDLASALFGAKALGAYR